MRNCSNRVQNAMQDLSIANSSAAKDKVNNNDKSVNDIISNSGDNSAIKCIRDGEDGLMLSLFSTMGDMARMYNYSKNYSDFDSSKNKKMPIATTLKYKYPFGLRKMNPVEQTPQSMMPGFNILMQGTQRLYFDEADKAFLCNFEPEGSFLLQLKNETELSHYTNLAEANNSNRNAGIDYSQLKFCPAMWDSDVPPQSNDLFNIGVYIDIDSAASECLKTAYNGLAVASVEDYKKLLQNGLVWAKVKLSTGSAADSLEGAVVHKSSIIYAPVLGATSKSAEKGIIKVGIDPMFFLTKSDLRNVYPIGIPGDSATLLSSKTIKEKSCTIDNYTEGLLKNVKNRKKFETRAKNGNKIGRIRLYIPSNYEEKVKNLFGERLKDSFNAAKEGESVYFPKELYSAGNKDINFTEYINVGAGGGCEPPLNAFRLEMIYGLNPNFRTGADCGNTTQQQAVAVIRQNNRTINAEELVGYFFKHCATYKVNPALAIAIFAHETGWGTSKKFLNEKNPGGITRYVGKTQYFLGYGSYENGIQNMAKTLSSSNYVNKRFRELGLTYCPPCDDNGVPIPGNDKWLGNVSKIISMLQAR